MISLLPAREAKHRLWFNRFKWGVAMLLMWLVVVAFLFYSDYMYTFTIFLFASALFVFSMVPLFFFLVCFSLGKKVLSLFLFCISFSLVPLLKLIRYLPGLEIALNNCIRATFLVWFYGLVIFERNLRWMLHMFVRCHRETKKPFSIVNSFDTNFSGFCSSVDTSANVAVFLLSPSLSHLHAFRSESLFLGFFALCTNTKIFH